MREKEKRKKKKKKKNNKRILKLRQQKCYNLKILEWINK